MGRIAPATVEGRCPGMLRDFLEVRGLGLLNIRTIFGETASRRKMKLKLIVHLQKSAIGADAPRLPLDAQTQEVLGVPIGTVKSRIARGRAQVAATISRGNGNQEPRPDRPTPGNPT